MAARYAWQWVAAASGTLLLALILGISLDIRIFLIYMMLVCLIAPLMLAWLFYHYGLHGRSYLNIVRHKIAVFPDRFAVIVEVRRLNNGERGEDSNEDDTCGDNITNGEEKRIDAKEGGEEDVEYRSFEFPLTALGRFSVHKDYVIFPFDSSEKGFLYVPVSAFASEEKFRDFIGLLSRQKF